jgi:hypothetical protein
MARVSHHVRSMVDQDREHALTPAVPIESRAPRSRRVLMALIWGLACMLAIGILGGAALMLIPGLAY